LDAFESGSPARVDLDGANCVGFAGVFRAVLARGPGCTDAADEIERRVVVFRQVDCDLAIADAVEWVVHGLPESGLECGSLRDGGPGGGHPGLQSKHVKFIAFVQELQLQDHPSSKSTSRALYYP